MVSVIYVILSVLIIGRLSLQVINARRKYKISVGDGDNVELQTVIGAQSNAVEYLPIALLLLFCLELNGAAYWLIHLFGIALITGRVIHARGMLARNIKHRVLGMSITFYLLLIMAAVNVIYLPYDKLILF